MVGVPVHERGFRIRALDRSARSGRIVKAPVPVQLPMVGKGTPRRACAPLNAAPKWYQADRSQDVSFRSRCIQCGQLTWPSYESAFDETFKLPLFTDFCACARRDDDKTCHAVCADEFDSLLTLLLGDSTVTTSGFSWKPLHTSADWALCSDQNAGELHGDRLDWKTPRRGTPDGCEWDVSQHSLHPDVKHHLGKCEI